jgi:hypothetical protein
MKRIWIPLVALSLAFGCSPPDDDGMVVEDMGAEEDSGTNPRPDAGGEDDTGTGEDGGTADAGDDASMTPALPSFDELDEGLNELFPGGDTSCARGQEYSFYVYKGDPTKLTIHYFGGGGCWNRATCQTDDVFTDGLAELREQIDAGEHPGIFDMENPDNPVNGWTHVIVPYCTGDVHWGTTVQDYGGGTVVHHRGGTNGFVIKKWILENMTAPEKVFVQGCSAGSYGALMWAPHFMEAYPNAEHFQLGDSGAGVITDSFFQESFPNWQAEPVFPSWIPSLDPMTQDITTKTIADLYTDIAATYPDATMAQFNTEFDETQTLFYNLMGGTGDAMGWSTQMYELTGAIDADSPNYLNWVAEGNFHCILPHDRFYTHETDGVLFRDWVDDMLNGEEVDDVTCAECSPPE